MFEALQPANESRQSPRQEGQRSALHRLLWLVRHDDEATAACLATAKQIDLGDGESWLRAWQSLAERCCAQAEAATQSHATAEAAKFWRQAANYHLVADVGNESGGPAPAEANRCVVRFIESLDPPGAAVAIPWLEGRALDGLWCPVNGPDPTAAPVVLCVAETRYRKEALVAMLTPLAQARRLALLCIELDAVGDCGSLDLRVRPETAIVAAIDYLIDGLGTDPSRIAVLADGSPSSAVASGVALDGRAAAAVCDAGLWTLWEQDQLGSDAGHFGFGGPVMSAALRCPTLVPLEARAGIDPAHAYRLLARRYPRHGQVVVKTFGTAAASGLEPDPILAADVLLDWLHQYIDPNPQADAPPARRLA